MPRGNSRPPAHVRWRRPKAIPPRAPDLGLPAGVSSSRPPSCGTRDVRREQEVGYSACATRTPKGDELGFLTRATGRVRSTPRSEHRPSTQRPLCGHLPPARVRRMMRENPPPVPNRAIARLRMLQASTLGLLRSDRHAGDCPRPPPAVIPERAHDLCHRGLEGGRTVGRRPRHIRRLVRATERILDKRRRLRAGSTQPVAEIPFRSWLNPTRSVVPLSIEK
jgi:hypothetical protein